MWCQKNCRLNIVKNIIINDSENARRNPSGINLFKGEIEMAGTMVHLVIADILSQHLKDKEITAPYYIKNIDVDYFIAGNICPDGIMARKYYVRDMKKHTHFRDDIMDYDFHKEENLALFRQRLYNFMEKNMETFKTNSMRSLYLGYWSHMVTDEMFMLQIRPEFMKNISVIGLTQHDMETYKYFGKDVDMIDFRLVNEYKGSKRIHNALAHIQPYEIHDMITEKELTSSRRWILNYFFETEHKNIVQPIYISYKRMLQFIDTVVAEIEEKFKSVS